MRFGVFENEDQHVLNNRWEYGNLLTARTLSDSKKYTNHVCDNRLKSWSPEREFVYTL